MNASLLTNLPDEVFSHINSYLTYDDIAKNRQVCRKFNKTGWYLLNRGLVAAKKLFNSDTEKAIKAQLPRQQSLRWRHPLNEKYLLVSTISIGLRFLDNFIEKKLCCFMPGKIIDEVFRLGKLLNAHGHLRELSRDFRDLLNMAQEHFNDNIAPILRKKEWTVVENNLEESIKAISILSERRNQCSLSSTPTRLVSIKTKCCKRSSRIEKLERKRKRDKARLASLKKSICEQNETIKELRKMFSQHEALTNDLKRRLDGLDNSSS